MGDSSERAEPLLISCSVKTERKRCRTTNRAETCSHVRCRPIADNADFAELIAMTPSEAFNLAASLVGQPISHVWQGYGSALFIGLAAYGRSPNAMACPATRKVTCRWGSNGDGGLSTEPIDRSRHDPPEPCRQAKFRMRGTHSPPPFPNRMGARGSWIALAASMIAAPRQRPRSAFAAAVVTSRRAAASCPSVPAHPPCRPPPR
jgi:hypothetical protein